MVGRPKLCQYANLLPIARPWKAVSLYPDFYQQIHRDLKNDIYLWVITCHKIPLKATISEK